MMDRKRILVVDDEQDLCDIIKINLTSAGYDADIAYSSEEALRKDITIYDLLLLDVMMPGISGFQFAQILKNDRLTKDIPLIFLTAKDAEDDMLKGFDIGADDYISKPFSVKELIARVNAVINRTSKANGKRQPDDDTADDTISFKGLTINAKRKEVSVDGNPVSFTPTELYLLQLFLSKRGTVFSRQKLIELVWPENVIVTDRTIDVNINRIRKKLGSYSKHIITRQGFGYYFEENI